QLLESLRSYLQPTLDRRREVRLPFAYEVQCTAAASSSAETTSLESRIYDVSLSGMRLWLPRRLPGLPTSLQVSVRLPGTSILLPTQVMNVFPCAARACEMGLRVDDASLWSR